MKTILEAINERPLVFDGAMGTMIYGRGVFINTCFDELSIRAPELIRGIHEEYVKAGADVIETNTFGANRIKLSGHGLSAEVESLNRAAVKLAREAAGDSVFVAGAVGPCLGPGQILLPGKSDDIEEAFAEQIGVLIDAGVDFIQLETFSDIGELQLAARIAKERGAVVFASFTVLDNGETAFGNPVEQVVSQLDDDDHIDGVGINCGVGPAQAYDALERALSMTGKPFVVMPNAGNPRQIEGRMLYLTTPEYFATYGQKFIEMGVRGVGGCCGTTPEHIRVAAKTLKSLSGVKAHVRIESYAREDNEVAVIPPKQKSRFASRLLMGKKVSSIELLPPKSWDMSVLLERARTCYLHGIDAINIPDGPRASSRISPMIASIAIREEIGIEPVLHYCCRDRNLIGMQSDLLGGYAAGIANFLIITGDPPKLGDYPDATGVFDIDAIGLTQVASNLNHGRDIGGNPIDPPTGIFIGVGANPLAVELKRERDRFLAKIDAGAEYAITQPVFDPEALFRFMDDVAEYTNPIPIVAGVWPLTSFKNAEFMNNEVPGVEVPDAILERMARCKTKEDGIRTGVEIAQEICEIISDRVAGYQVSAPFGKVDAAIKVLDGFI